MIQSIRWLLPSNSDITTTRLASSQGPSSNRSMYAVPPGQASQVPCFSRIWLWRSPSEQASNGPVAIIPHAGMRLSSPSRLVRGTTKTMCLRTCLRSLK